MLARNCLVCLGEGGRRKALTDLVSMVRSVDLLIRRGRWCGVGWAHSHLMLLSAHNIERIAREVITPWLFSCGGRLTSAQALEGFRADVLFAKGDARWEKTRNEGRSQRTTPGLCWERPRC